MTQVSIANEALAQIGTRSQLTGTVIDPTENNEALYASLLFAPLRDFLLTEGDYDFSMEKAALTPAGVEAPWSFAYAYPAAALRIRQLIPAALVPNDPRPLQWNVLNVAGVRRIMTQQEVTHALYTLAAADNVWSPIFHDAYVRLLGSALAFALENRIEASDVKLKEAISFAGIANLRDP